MNASYQAAAVAFASVWIGAAVSSQTPSPDWSGSPGPAASSAGDVNGDGYDDVIVGGWGFSNPQTEEGRARIYLGSASGLASTPTWTVEGNQVGAGFGWRVAGVGDVNGDGFDDVIVTAPYFDGAEGRATLYLGSPTGPSTTPSWTQDGPTGSSYLGFDLAAAGDVNADGFDDVIIGIPGQGTADVYRGSPSGALIWTWQAFGFNGVGNAVSGAGDVDGDGFDDVVVGVPWDGDGSVYVFPGTSSGPSLTEWWQLESDGPNYEFGRKIAPAGDVDGDGFGDIAVYSGNTNLSRRVFVFGGSPTGPTLAWSALGAHDNFAWGLAAGDLNGDGYDDLIVGASDFDVTPQGDEGRVVVYEGSSTGLSTPAWSATGEDLDGHLGMSVGAADVDGDGYSDMVVTDDPLYAGNGAAYAYHGSRTGLDAPPRHRRPPRGPRFP